MGVARSIEERLEGMVEGFFAKVFKSGLQPVEVGRRILKQMADLRTVSVNRVYAPNLFDVHMASEDHKRFAQMHAELHEEFSELVIQQAKENRWRLMGLPRITFHEDEALGRGQFKVQASLEADPRAVAADRTSPGGRPGTAELVEVTGTGDTGERWPVSGRNLVIGRLDACDVTINDPNVSRRHAEIRGGDGAWTLVDLGSTNGTVVNGSETNEHELVDGDVIVVGSTQLMFTTGEEA